MVVRKSTDQLKQRLLSRLPSVGEGDVQIKSLIALTSKAVFGGIGVLWKPGTPPCFGVEAF